MIRNPPAKAETQETRVQSLLGRSLGGGHGNPLQYSCLANPMDSEAWQATVRGITKSQTRLMTLLRPLGMQIAVFSLCPHRAIYLQVCVLIASSYKDTSHTGLDLA